MRMLRYAPLILLAVIFTSGCATTTPPPEASAVPARSASPAAKTGKTTSPAPTISQPAAPTGPAVQVDVNVSDDKLSSSMTTFHVGTAYLFVVKNTGTHELCFDIAPPEHATGSLAASLTAALVDIPQNKLPTGAVVQAPYTFGDSAVGVPLELSCLVRRAYDDNVRLAITVTN